MKHAFMTWSCTHMPELNASISVCVMRLYVSMFSLGVLDLCFFLLGELKQAQFLNGFGKRMTVSCFSQFMSRPDA